MDYTHVAYMAHMRQNCIIFSELANFIDLKGQHQLLDVLDPFEGVRSSLDHIWWVFWAIRPFFAQMLHKRVFAFMPYM